MYQVFIFGAVDHWRQLDTQVVPAALREVLLIAYRKIEVDPDVSAAVFTIDSGVVQDDIFYGLGGQWSGDEEQPPGTSLQLISHTFSHFISGLSN